MGFFSIFSKEKKQELDKGLAPTSLTFVGRDGVEEPIPLPPSPVLPPDARGASPMHGVSYANMVYEIAAFRDAIAGRSDHRRLLSLTAAVMRTVERIREAQG